MKITKKYLIIIISIILVILTTLLILKELGWHKNCGGFTGEIGQNQCNQIFNCVNENKHPDAYGNCKLKILNI